MGGRGERPAHGVPEEQAPGPERAAPEPPGPMAAPWRAVGDAKGAARGSVEILLALDYDESPLARGEVRDGAFAVDLPALRAFPPVLLRRAKLVARVDAPGFLPARSLEPGLGDREPGDVRLDVQLETGACVRGRAVDDTGRPVGDAEIWFSPRGANVSTTSDTEGCFVLPVREATEYWLCARKGDVGVGVRGPLRLSPLADFDAGDLVVRGPGILEGVAVYPDGTPARHLGLHAAPASLRDTKVSSWPDAPFDAAKDGPPTGLAWGWTTTADDGRFVIRGLGSGPYFFLEDKLRETFETGTGVRVVIDLHRILVRILDERGSPAALDASARSDSGDSVAGKVDDFVVRPGQRWTITIGDRGLVPAAVVVEVVPEQREYEVTLVARTPTEFGRAQVTLLDPRGAPFAAVRVRLDALPGGNVILFDEKLDDLGRTPEVPAGRYSLEAMPLDRLAPYFPAATEVDLRAGTTTPVTLSARPGGRVQLTFRREGGAAGEEVGTVKVEALPAAGGEPVRLVRLFVRSNGGYEIGGEWKLLERASGWQLLEPGQYRIHVEAKGHRPVVVPVLVQAQEVAEVEVVLEPADSGASAGR